MYIGGLEYICIQLFLPISLSLCPSDFLCASYLKFQRNRRIRRHPELIDFPKTWAQNMTIYESAWDKCCVCLSGKHIFLVFPFLEKWNWLSTNHWEGVLFMSCQKLQHDSFSLLVVLTLFVIMLCVVWRKPQCVLFVMGARGWGRCVFNYHLVEWLMVRQSGTELQLSECVPIVCATNCFVHLCVWLPASVFLCDLFSDFSHILLSFSIVGSANCHHYTHCYWTHTTNRCSQLLHSSAYSIVCFTSTTLKQSRNRSWWSNAEPGLTQPAG